MNNWKLVRLNFGRSPTHFGETGIGIEQISERVRSDTLFSAWISTYAKSFGKSEVEALLQKFRDNPTNPPFRISSTFVYHRSDEQTFIDYLPKLAEHPLNYPNDDLRFVKSFRKLKFIPISIWQRWYQGQGFTNSDICDLETYAKNPDDETTTLAQAGCFSYAKAFNEYVLPKVAIDRTTRVTNFYHTGFVQFAWEAKELKVSEENQAKSQKFVDDNERVENKAGLYFLLNISDDFLEVEPDLESDLIQSLAILGEEGLGGERSSGAGRFTILSWESLPPEWEAIINFQSGDHYSLVSLFWDDSVSLDWLGESSRYTLQERGGWIASPYSGRQLRRQMIRMFEEGSVFPEQPCGQLADVTPEGFNQHAIYRNGIAVSLSVKLKEEVA